MNAFHAFDFGYGIAHFDFGLAESGDLVPDFDIYDPDDRKSTFVLDEDIGLLVKSA